MTQLFVDNKYAKLYYRIVNHAMVRTEIGGKNESHHIIPRSLGGSNSNDNLVKLSIREHFICHWLLTKMVIGNSSYKMYKALHKMSQGRELSSRQYEIARRANIKAMIENNPTKDITVRNKISDAHIGMSHSKETRQKCLKIVPDIGKERQALNVDMYFIIMEFLKVCF